MSLVPYVCEWPAVIYTWFCCTLPWFCHEVARFYIRLNRGGLLLRVLCVLHQTCLMIQLSGSYVLPKNTERERNSSCYIALCAKSVGNFTTVTDRQLFGFGNLWFYTFIKDLCLEKCYSIYLVKIIQQSIHEMWKKQQHYFIAKPMEAVCWLPTDNAWPQLLLATQCYSNILLVCLSWVLPSRTLSTEL